MFLFKVLGLFDFLAGLMIILSIGNIVPFRLVLGHALYLILKGYIFKGDLLSLIDAGIGIFAIISLILPMSFLSIIVAIYLIGKGFFSII